MSSVTTPPIGQSVRTPPPYPIYKISVARYHQMIQAGILTEDDPVELLEGWIVPKMPHNPTHDGTIDLCQAAIRPCLPAGWFLRIQQAITLGDSEPEPDIAIVRGTARSYLARHPGPADIGGLIEVANTSIAEDRIDKGRIYARANILVYWVINLVQMQVEVYTDPDPTANPPRYRQRLDCPHGQQVPLTLLGQVIGQVRVDELLP